MDVSRYRGTGIFGPAYRVMLANDAHAPPSVDRVLQNEMVLLCPATAEHLYSRFTPTELRYRAGSRPILEKHLGDAIGEFDSKEQLVSRVARFCRDLGADVGEPVAELRLGGTEEQIIQRGSDWCTDVARVGCVLCQMAGAPARIVYLANTGAAYSGHVIVEAFRNGRWGTVDTSGGVVYHHPDGRPAATWELMCRPELVAGHFREGQTPYTKPEQFKAAAVANYFVWDSTRYDYTVTGPNDYYVSILENAKKQWPGGLRWLHGEDKAS